MMPDPQTFETYRWLLFSIAYRMLGSAMEAEDMVQEAYIRYSRADAGSIDSPKAYLTTIVTRLCLDALKSARAQREEYFGTWLPEPVLTGPSPSALVSQHESISMAFMVLLENLSPIERAIFLLRDVFDYPYAEIAEMVGKSEANCRRYFRRAKQYLVERRPRFMPSPTEQHRLVDSFLRAITSGDVEGLTHLLAEDVTLYGDGGGKAFAIREPLAGRAAVLRLLLGGMRLMPPDGRIEVAEVNGAESLLFWAGDALGLVMNFVITDGVITTIHNVLNPDKLAYIQGHGGTSQG
jgi:RNA polymerase sigma-70 factor (ECF subfamily)